MRLSLHIRPDRRDLTSEGMVPGRQTDRLDEIAELLTHDDVESRVLEEPIGAAPESDFWLVYADDQDLKWHLDSIPMDDREKWTRRLFLLNPSRDVAFDLLDDLGAAGAVGFDGAIAWERPPKTGTVVRRDIAQHLGGVLGLGLPFFKETERYASWKDSGHQTLAAQVVTYLREAMTVLGPTKRT